MMSNQDTFFGKLEMNDNNFCLGCKVSKSWQDFKSLRRGRGSEGYARARRIKSDVLICDTCHADPVIGGIAKRYRAIRFANKRRFGEFPQLTFPQLLNLAMESGWSEMVADAMTKGCWDGKHTAMPSVDRIESWRGYDFDNIQILSLGRNIAKNNHYALGAQRATMRLFKKLREEKGLTKYEMAKFLEMSPSTYYYYEDEAKGCSFEILCLIRRKLEISWERIGQLIDDEFSRPSKSRD